MGSDTGKFVKLNPTTGAIVKEVKFGGMVRSSPAIARDGTVVVGSDSKKVVALDPNTLLPKWTYEAGSEIGSKVENY